MNQYVCKFITESYSYWTVEANNLEEAEEKALSISDNGTFVDEEVNFYDLISVSLEEENIEEDKYNV